MCLQVEFAQLFHFVQFFPLLLSYVGIFAHTHRGPHHGPEGEEQHRMVSTSGSSEQKAPGATLSSPGHGQEILFMTPLMLSDMSLTSSVHYICPCHKKPRGMVFILRSVCAFCSFHFQFALLFLKVHWGLLHLSIWFPSLSSYCNLLPLVIYHYAFLYSFMWFFMVAAASRNKLPASEGISYLFIF